MDIHELGSEAVSDLGVGGRSNGQIPGHRAPGITKVDDAPSIPRKRAVPFGPWRPRERLHVSP